MSYDVYLQPSKEKCEHCGRPYGRVSGPDPTYNLSPIFDLALTGEDFPNKDVTEGQVVLLHAATDRPRGLRVLNGQRAGDSLAQLDQAIARLADETLRPAFVALEPSNGWGNLAGAVSVMQELRELARRNPDHVWDVR